MIDVKVETEALERAYHTLRRRSEKMECVTDFLIKRLDAIHPEFDDENFKRTYNEITGVKAGIYQVSEKISSLNKSLKELERIIFDYANGGYKG